MSDTVRAWVQTGPREMDLREFSRPTIGPEEGLVRVEANGLCGSDVEAYRGHMFRGQPYVPGHEPVGIIDEIGEQAAARWGVAVGDRVAIEIVIPCHHCANCIVGNYHACTRRGGAHGVTPIDVAPAIWGGLSEYTYLAPGSIVHPISNDLPIETAAMFNSVAAGVRWSVHYGGAGMGSTVLVLGAGQRGLTSVIAAKAAGADTVIVTGLSSDAHKLELARRFGADHTIVVDEQDTVETVMDLTNGVGVDLAMELTPMASQPILDAIESVRHGGRIVVAGLKGGRETPIPTDRFVNKAITLVGAFGVDAKANRAAIRLLESGRHPFAEMHTHSLGLEDAVEAIELLGGDRHDDTPAVHVSVHPDR